MPDHLEDLDNDELPKAIDKAFESGAAVQMRSSLDDLPMTKAIRIYWHISLICMLCAFGGALEGYRTLRSHIQPIAVQISSRAHTDF